MRSLKVYSVFFSVLMLTGCNASYAPDELQLVKTSPSQLRVIQSKQFDQKDQAYMLQSVIKTLASLDFQIIRTDTQVGLIEAIQLNHDHIMQLNIVVQSLPAKGITVRMNARYDQYPVEDPMVYQRFFETLSRNVS